MVYVLNAVMRVAKRVAQCYLVRLVAGMIRRGLWSMLLSMRSSRASIKAVPTVLKSLCLSVAQAEMRSRLSDPKGMMV